MPPLIRNDDHLHMELSSMPNPLLASSDLKIAEHDYLSRLTHNKYTENANLLDHILKNNWFALFEQRQWNMDLRQPIGTEVLLRVPNANDSQLYLSTSFWIEFAESTGKLEELSYKIIEKLLRNVHLLNPLHAPYYVNMPPPAVSVALVDHIKMLLDRAGLPYNFIGIELTERQPILDIAKFKRGLNALQLLKIPVALDDYGRGYATMQLLRDLHVDRVKIDRGLLHDAKINLSKRLTLVSLLDFATEFSIDVIAEGVEIESDYDFVCQLGCDGIQGFYIDSPQMLIPVEA